MIRCLKKDDAFRVYTVYCRCLCLTGCREPAAEITWTAGDSRQGVVIDPDFLFFEVEDMDDVEQVLLVRKDHPRGMLTVYTGGRIPAEMIVVPKADVSGLLDTEFDEERFHRIVMEQIAIYRDGGRREPEGKRLIVSYDGDTLYLPVEEIIYLEAKDKRICLHHKGGTAYFWGVLKEVGEELDGMFLRVHRSYLVNPIYIRKISFSERKMILADQSVIPVSKTFRNRISETERKITGGLRLM